MIRFGLCCLFRDEPVRFRQTTAAVLRRLPRPQQLRQLSALCLANAHALQQALAACHRLGIGAFRIMTPLFPRYTHPEVGYQLQELPAADAIAAALRQAGEYARRHDLRLSLHPDPFVLLNSPRSEVVRKSMAELTYQALLAELAGIEAINLHAGGVYGDKPAALAALRRAVEALPDTIRRRLTLENDDRSYPPAELVPVCRDLGLPFVYDVHHHRCLADGWSVERATAACVDSWAGREPWLHLSSPRAGWDGSDPRPHADYIDPADWPPEWAGLTATVDIEAKDKERAVLTLMRDLGAGGDPTRRESF